MQVLPLSQGLRPKVEVALNRQAISRTSHNRRCTAQLSFPSLCHPLCDSGSFRKRPIHSLRKLLEHQHSSTTQLCVQVYDETLYEQLKSTMSRLEAIPVSKWPADALEVEAEPIGQQAEARAAIVGLDNSV